MSERLSRDYFDQLAYAGWQLGRLSMRHLFEIAPVPAMVKGEVYFEDTIVETEFEVREPYPRLLKIMPRIMELTIDDVETFQQDQEFALYPYKKLRLDTVNRTRSYTEGVYIMDEWGNMISPLLDRPVPGRAFRPGRGEFRRMREELSTFTPIQADGFLTTLHRAIDHVQSQKNN